MRRRNCVLSCASILGAALLACPASAVAQPSLTPRNAQSLLYFAHMAEGGPDANNYWQAKIVLVNSNAVAAHVSLNFYDNNGAASAVDFGSGPASTLAVTVPPLGTQTFTSVRTHQAWYSGWASGDSDVPVFAQMQYRLTSNGQVTTSVSADATSGTAQWMSTAGPYLGIAVANPSPSDAMTYIVDVRNADGTDFGSQSFPLAPLGHDAFVLNGRFQVPAGFAGSVIITGQTTQQSVYKPVVWTLGWDAGLNSTLPDGRALMPDDQMSRAMRVFGRMLAMAHQMGYQVNPQLTLTPGTGPGGIANASGGVNGSGDFVTMYMSMVEMVGDSDGELAFLMAHQIGHVIQCHTNGCNMAVDGHFAGDPESDADEMGMMLSTAAGYDSYSGAGAYARLQVGNGQMSMGGGMMGAGAVVWENMTSTDPHGFFANRINMMYQVQQRMCTNAKLATNCLVFKNLMHPSTGGINMPM